MASREAMLEALRRNAPREVPRPDLSGLGAHYPDRVAQFSAALAGVGGTCLVVPDLLTAHRALAEQPSYRDAKRVVSLVAGVGHANLDPSALAGPHELEGLDLAILPGELGVAENGAVYLDGARLPQRALYVIAEHLVLVVEAGAVVNDMHEAYARLAERKAGYGLFISGPSKTADIEQALVIGAQGPRSCTVLLVGPPA
ncbi:MAG TPA: LUD domain-containing protein [Anaeromyxobacteraceae bacterium]|nr:LUD domain-containing protein [Anaeromyxobacteraceae bacterium]